MTIEEQVKEDLDLLLTEKKTVQRNVIIGDQYFAICSDCGTVKPIKHCYLENWVMGQVLVHNICIDCFDKTHESNKVPTIPDIVLTHGNEAEFDQFMRCISYIRGVTNGTSNKPGLNEVETEILKQFRLVLDTMRFRTTNGVRPPKPSEVYAKRLLDGEIGADSLE